MDFPPAAPEQPGSPLLIRSPTPTAEDWKNTSYQVRFEGVLSSQFKNTLHHHFKRADGKNASSMSPERSGVGRAISNGRRAGLSLNIPHSNRDGKVNLDVDSSALGSGKF